MRPAFKRLEACLEHVLDEPEGGTTQHRIPRPEGKFFLTSRIDALLNDTEDFPCWRKSLLRVGADGYPGWYSDEEGFFAAMRPIANISLLFLTES